MSQQSETKIAKLVEAMEDFAIGVTIRTFHRIQKGAEPQVVTKHIDDARAALESALRDFLQPSLRLLEGGSRQIEIVVPEKDRPKCAECHRHYCCGNVACEHWHKAIRDNLLATPKKDS